MSDEEAEIVQLTDYWIPSAETLQVDLDRYRGSYQPAYVGSPLSLGGDNTSPGPAFGMYQLVVVLNFFARAFGMMLIGMALYTWGVLTASKSDLFYRRMLVVGLTIGPILSIVGLLWHEQNDWDALYSGFAGQVPNIVATPFTALGYVALIMLWSRTAFWHGLQNRLADVGKMALTNYISQSLLATFIFHGWGLGLYGSVDRATQLLFVLAIWGLQLVISPWWMARFRYGPLEWGWRSLSLLQLQPIRRDAS